DVTAEVVDKIKSLGFASATRAGATIAVDDVTIPPEKATTLADTERRVGEIERQFRRGLITEEERYNTVVAYWTEATDKVMSAMMKHLEPFGSLYVMATAGAGRNPQQMCP